MGFSAGDAVGLESRGDRQADGLVGAGFICHHQIRIEWGKPALYALNGGVERFKVDSNVRFIPYGVVRQFTPNAPFMQDRWANLTKF